MHCTSTIPQEGSGAPILTDDVSLQVFMDHLKKLAVSSSTWIQTHLPQHSNNYMFPLLCNYCSSCLTIVHQSWYLDLDSECDDYIFYCMYIYYNNIIACNYCQWRTCICTVQTLYIVKVSLDSRALQLLEYCIIRKIGFKKKKDQ